MKIMILLILDDWHVITGGGGEKVEAEPRQLSQSCPVMRVMKRSVKHHQPRIIEHFVYKTSDKDRKCENETLR